MTLLCLKTILQPHSGVDRNPVQKVNHRSTRVEFGVGRRELCVVKTISRLSRRVRGVVPSSYLDAKSQGVTVLRCRSEGPFTVSCVPITNEVVDRRLHSPRDKDSSRSWPLLSLLQPTREGSLLF